MKKILCILTFLIIFFTCLHGQSQKEKLVVNDFFSKMTVGVADSGNKIDTEDELFWENFLSLGYKKNKENKSLLPPNIKPILDYTLILNGDTIKEEKIEVRKKTIGEAFCINGKPAIRYYTKLKYIDGYGIAFFRMHEYAHFLLGHMDCNGNVFPKPELELAADKKAIELLEQFKDGDRVVDHARGILLGLNTKGTSTHPSSRERAEKFYE